MLGNYKGLLRVLKLRMLPRLFRLSKFIKFVRSQAGNAFFDILQTYLNLRHGFMRLIYSVLTIAISLHIAACTFYLTAKFDEFGPETWIIRNNYADSSNSHNYLSAMYWGLTTISSVGYGDINAITNAEKIVSIT